MNTEALNELSHDIDDMLDNAAAIKGEPFARLVAFLNNVNALTALTAGVVHEAIPAECQREALEAMATILARICSDHSRALGVDPADIPEATRLADTIQARVQQASKHMQ